MMPEEWLSEDEINQHFVAMGHSVDLIDATIADDTEAKKMLKIWSNGIRIILNYSLVRVGQ